MIKFVAREVELRRAAEAFLEEVEGWEYCRRVEAEDDTTEVLLDVAKKFRQALMDHAESVLQYEDRVANREMYSRPLRAATLENGYISGIHKGHGGGCDIEWEHGRREDGSLDYGPAGDMEYFLLDKNGCYAAISGTSEFWDSLSFEGLMDWRRNELDGFLEFTKEINDGGAYLVEVQFEFEPGDLKGEVAWLESMKACVEKKCQDGKGETCLVKHSPVALEEKS